MPYQLLLRVLFAWPVKYACQWGENGQIPPFCKICSKKALFWNLLVIYHFSSIELYKLEFQMVLDHNKLEFLEVLPPWHHLTWHLGLKKTTWYSSLRSSSTVLVWYPSPLNLSINLYVRPQFLECKNHADWYSSPWNSSTVLIVPESIKLNYQSVCEAPFLSGKQNDGTV